MRLAVATNHNAGGSSMDKNSKTSRTGLREHLPLAPRREQNFRWRGNEISRVEGFTDAVFAFAVTLLVVALEVPHTFDGLMDVVRGFPAFVICFTLLMTVLERPLHLSPALRSRRRVLTRDDHGHHRAGAVLRLSTEVSVHHGHGGPVRARHARTLRTSRLWPESDAVPDLWPGVRRSVGAVRRAVCPRAFAARRSCSSMPTKSFSRAAHSPHT